MTGRSGPKVSSRITAISAVASAISVGAKNCPFPRSVRGAPPVSTRAPRATASATWRSARAICGAKVTAPTSMVAWPGPSRPGMP